MRLGILIPHRAVVLQSVRRPPVEECWQVARLCDEAGMDLWVGDSVVAKPRLEPLTTLAYLAAITKRARLGTAILLPALRQPTVLAHALANIDQLSQGRLVLGLGVGWGLPEIVREWEACGREHKRRAKDLEEHVIVWRKLWSGEPVTHQGNGFKLSDHTIGPLPWTEAGPPVLITAGNRGEFIPAQIDRVGRLGDGVVTTYLTDDDCRKLRQVCDEALVRHGRPRPGFPMCVYTTVRIEDDAAKAEALTREFLQKYYGGGVNYRGLMGLGPAGAVVETLKRYEEAGATDLCIRFAGTDQVPQLERFIRDVAPAFAAR
ncbi:MAG: LLM class flavin-dependent oxidoreductase [Betaproteobacteria bacterium]|nr:LLM class flavin-dependent oxidoreductase [Betaproteobacteria bacterium]MDH3437983.1 LLM class flavin-dependent oxidoreductase [Betaproteobacteria bacterium]